jgi:hypothetical protein
MGGIYYADKCLFCPTVYMLLAGQVCFELKSTSESRVTTLRNWF